MIDDETMTARMGSGDETKTRRNSKTTGARRRDEMMDETRTI